ncbi:hypothetical protein B6K86_03845 [Lachnospiraceae bacterium]|nr:hypothetical protein B6K86_03845 [Lachnospiraceae bacterium]
MKFQSINELPLFSFRDCVLERFEQLDSTIRLTVEALIVLPANSQNSCFTESYAGTSTIRLTNARLLSAVKEGFRRYNAEGVLWEESPDLPLSEAELAALLPQFTDCYLYEMVPEPSDSGTPSVYEIAIEFPPENPYDTVPTDSYRLRVCCDKAIVDWDFYRNRLQE